METKKTRKFFTIFEYEKEETYLQEMHKDGWKLVKVTGLCQYHFEKCQPEDIIYQLDYNQEGIAHKEEYVKLFNDCGWEYIQDYMGYSYFRKPASETAATESIFCDQNSKNQMLERIYKGKILPLIAIFACLIIPQLVYSLIQQNSILILIFTILTLVYVFITLTLARQYRKLKKE